MRVGRYAVLVRTPAIDTVQPRPGTIDIVPDTEPALLVGELYGAEADYVVLVGPLNPRFGPLESHRFRLVDGKAFLQSAQHDRLTPLEALLLRALYTYACNWASEGAAEAVASLAQEHSIDEDEAHLLEQLLEEEQADRQ